MKANVDTPTPWVLYSCYSASRKEVEKIVPEHAFCQVISGKLEFYLAGKRVFMKEGDTFLFKRNQLSRSTKHPGKNGIFESTTVWLDQPVLQAFGKENNIIINKAYTGDTVVLLKTDPLYKSYVESLAPYIKKTPVNSTKKVINLKVRELLFILLELESGLKELLFDFSEPGKIDLEEFMNTHFEFNVQLQRFAFLTGRSLATFKRDFQKIFQTSPGRWLLQRRLQEAFYLIKEKGKAPSDIYLDLGFEDLSHFSFAFKKAYGMSPSKV